MTLVQHVVWIVKLMRTNLTMKTIKATTLSYGP